MCYFIVSATSLSTRYKCNVKTIYGKDAIILTSYLSFMIYRSSHISRCARNHRNYIVSFPAVNIKARYQSAGAFCKGETLRKVYFNSEWSSAGRWALNHQRHFSNSRSSGYYNEARQNMRYMSFGFGKERIQLISRRAMATNLVSKASIDTATKTRKHAEQQRYGSDG